MQPLHWSRSLAAKDFTKVAHGHLTETGSLGGSWSFSRFSHPVDGQLHSLQGSVQNEDVSPLLQKAGKICKLFVGPRTSHCSIKIILSWRHLRINRPRKRFCLPFSAKNRAFKRLNCHKSPNKRGFPSQEKERFLLPDVSRCHSGENLHKRAWPKQSAPFTSFPYIAHHWLFLEILNLALLRWYIALNSIHFFESQHSVNSPAPMWIKICLFPC